MSSVIIPIDHLDLEDRDQVLAQLSENYKEGFYQGSLNERKQHVWYLLFGLVAGFLSGAVGMYFML